MADKERKLFTLRELTEILIKHADIHEGIWGPMIEFGFGAGNMPIAGPSNEFALRPAGIVSISQIGLQKFDEQNPLTVDAKTINPTRSAPRQRG
jgi:hypothetical protein